MTLFFLGHLNATLSLTPSTLPGVMSKPLVIQLYQFRSTS